jgi:hypothetical protein
MASAWMSWRPGIVKSGLIVMCSAGGGCYELVMGERRRRVGKRVLVIVVVHNYRRFDAGGDYFCDAVLRR